MTPLNAIDAAFGSVEKPEHFCNYTHCDECEEHDRLLRERDRTTLVISDVENPGWDPICFASPQGIGYYMPALARFALSDPTRTYGWYGQQLIFHLSSEGVSNRFRSYCSPVQQDAIARLLIEMRIFAEATAATNVKLCEIADVIDLWRT